MATAPKPADTLITSAGAYPDIDIRDYHGREICDAHAQRKAAMSGGRK